MGNARGQDLYIEYIRWIGNGSEEGQSRYHWPWFFRSQDQQVFVEGFEGSVAQLNTFASIIGVSFRQTAVPPLSWAALRKFR